ncbi:DUF302 domain-containing protein [Aliishimia ponticola]|uniref:DUF302 domain-containing protein n=1 Tax=Aliishimia ponticola TaxID=2499833 RepID=A0A4S4NPV7_9RHOB|nr:DUF302 domain-containing protein [Aliishimia ponticola]THH38250.1 DUF302 domain-containing protein [Aliishimia ponticola]
MLRTLITTATLGLAALPALADDLIRKSSPHSVAETMDKLEAAVTKAGATVFARIDHAGGAEKVGMELADAQVLIFGNPKLGTPAMQADITAGLDLPLRVLVAQGESGVEVIYHAPASLAAAYDIPADAKPLQMMTGALDKLTGAAIAAE